MKTKAVNEKQSYIKQNSDIWTEFLSSEQILKLVWNRVHPTWFKLYFQIQSAKNKLYNWSTSAYFDCGSQVPRSRHPAPPPAQTAAQSEAAHILTVGATSNWSYFVINGVFI